MATLKRTVLGIEISTREIRMVEMRGGNPPQVIKAGAVPLPPNALDGDRIVQTDAVADLVRGLHARLGCQGRSVVVGMGLQNVVTRVLDIPRVPDSELRVVLEGELAHYQILRAGAGAFDYYRLNNPTPQEDALPSVLLMATEDRIAQGYRVVIEKAGLQFLALEPVSLALFRSAFPLLRAEPGVLCLTITPSRSELSILDQGQIRLYRRVDQGSDDFIRGRRKPSTRVPGSSMDLTMEREAQLGFAPEVRPARSLLNPDEGDTDELQTGDLFSGRSGTGGLAGSGRLGLSDEGGGKVIPQGAASLSNEVQRSLDYYQREFPNSTAITRVILASNDPEAAEVATWLSQSLQMDVRVVEPPMDSTLPPAILTLLRAPQGLQFLGAMGLALQALTSDWKQVPQFNLLTSTAQHTATPVERDRLTAVMVGAVCILIGGFFMGLLIGRNASGEADELERLRKQYALNQQDYAALDKKIQDEQALGWIVKSDNLPIPAILDQITRDLPINVGLTNLQISRNGHIIVEGSARDVQEFDLYYLSLKTCPRFIGTRAMLVTSDPVTRITTFRIETSLWGTQAAQSDASALF